MHIIYQKNVLRRFYILSVMTVTYFHYIVRFLIILFPLQCFSRITIGLNVFNVFMNLIRHAWYTLKLYLFFDKGLISNNYKLC